MKTLLCALALATAATVLPSAAQTMRYPVKSVDFDIWCTEIQHIAWQRCDKRTAEDLEKFEIYRHAVERYEIPYLKQRDNALHFDESILHNDPIDKRPDSTLQKPPGAVDGN